MPNGKHERRKNLYSWPSGGRFRAIPDWIAAGYDVAGGYWSLVLRQKQLTPENLVEVTGYKDYIHRPDVHPLVWIKPGILECLKSSEGVLVEWMGPSGSGKDTIKDRAQNTTPELFSPIITHTTRPARPNEINGVTYNFIPSEKFDELITDDALAEYVYQGDHKYGTTFEAIESALQTNSVALWRGEPVGGEHLKHQIGRKYMGRIACVQMMTIPTTSLRTLYRWIEDKRGVSEAKSWRQQRAFLDIIAGGTMDIFIENPLQEEGPVQATEAFIATLDHIHSHMNQRSVG